MKKKNLIFASASGVLALALLAGVSTIGASEQKMAKAGNSHTSHTSALKEIGFNWENPTEEGFKPYWRCMDCCVTDKDPANSRYSDEAGKNAVTEASLRLAPLTSVSESSVEGEEIANISIVENTDQNVKEEGGDESVSTYYVSDSDKSSAIYFSRSHVTGEGDGKESKLLFATSAKSIGSVTFSYRYQNWSDATTVNALFNSSDVSDPISGAITLDNDGAWHTVTVNYSDIASGESARANFTGFGLKFADLRGYIMISGLSYAHGHVYNDDHICPDDGYSDPGKLSVDLDGNLNDTKWASFDKTNSLFDVASDGRGLKVKGFTDSTYAYFSFEIFSNTNAFANTEVIFNGGGVADQSTVKIGSDGITHWSSKFIGAVAKTVQLESGLYCTTAEMVAKLSVVAPSGTLSASFGAVVTGELSDCSYSEEQKEYWVLNGVNPWNGPASAFSVDAEGIHHNHTYENGKCIWCDVAAPTDYAITPDGNPSDWDEAIAKKYIGTDGEEGRHFGWNAFTDDKYLYVTSTVTHKCAQLYSLRMLRNSDSGVVEENIALSSDGSYTFGGTGLVDGGYKETTDATTGLTTSVFEFVFEKEGWMYNGVMNIGMLAYSSDASLHFDINHAGIPGYWGITASHNSWGDGGRFNVTSSGVEHTHGYSEGKCYLCGEAQPSLSKTPAITLDGDLSDFSDAAKNTKITNTATNGESISLTGFADDDFAYIGVEVKTTSSGVSILEACGKVNSTYYPFNIAAETIYTTSTNSKCASSRSYDSTTSLYSYTLEIAILKNSFTIEADNSVKIGVSVNGCSSNAELTCDSSAPTFWGINNLNTWWGEQHCFTFSASGVAAPGSAS